MAGDDGVLPRLATGATRVSYPKSLRGPNCCAEINRGCGCWGKFAGNIPSGYVKIAIEKWPFIVDFPIKNGGSFHSYVSLPEGIT
jgi:hypothetical protein